MRVYRLDQTGIRDGVGPASSGVALLEVLIALALFVAAAAVVTTALNSSLESLERQRTTSVGLQLAASVMAELQLGIRSPSGEGRRPLEIPFQDWTWETAVSPVESGGEVASNLNRVEVIIRNQNSPVVQRLAQVIRISPGTSTNFPSAPL
jgi:type II secretion system protein I